MKNLFLKRLNKIGAFVLILTGYSSVLLCQHKIPTQIDDDLRKNAHVVIQNHETIIEIESATKTILKETITATVLNDDNHLDRMFTRFVADDQFKIQSLNIILHDSKGKVVEKIKKGDFHDVAYFDGMSVHTDNRILTYNIHELKTPYTIVVELVMELKQLMAVPDWTPVGGEYISLERSSLTIIHPADFKIYHVGQHVNEPSVVTKGGKKIYTWKKERFLALNNVSKYDTPVTQLIPTVSWVPSRFDFGGAQGGFDAWADYGAWLSALGKESQDLPQSAIDEVNKLITPEMSKIEKTKVVYNYLQGRSRYVSIQLGIGGWKPFAASTVHKTQYGDCKALSNYTQALLKEVGVESFYSLIYAGRSGQDIVNPKFPSNTFNHAVVLVPFQEDTVLLECTSQQMPCGYRSAFTDNRYALAVTENGGKLVRTLQYSLDDNKQTDSIWLKINERAESQLHAKSHTQGILANQYRLLNQPLSDQRKWITDHVSFGQFDIQSFQWKTKESDGFNYMLELETELVSNNFADLSGTRIFIPLGVYSEFGEKGMVDSMQYSFQLRDAYQHRICAVIDLPSSSTLETTLKPARMEYPFGTYELNFKFNEQTNQLIVNRELVIKNGLYDKAVYQDYKKFKKDIYKIEHKPIVFLKQP